MKIPFKVRFSAIVFNLWSILALWSLYSAARIGYTFQVAMSEGKFIDPYLINAFVVFCFMSLWLLRQWEMVYDRKITIWENNNL